MIHIIDDKLNFASIPKAPGCYIFRNKSEHIIYIGKSKSLRNRIKQHFNNTDPNNYKHIDMMKELHSIEIIEADSETNALILECQLIKMHKPKYNSQLKKSRIYPFIGINLNRLYPTITIEDNLTQNGYKYYGCFYNKEDAFNTLELINSIWQTPICCRGDFSSTHRSCLNFHLKKCLAPCAGEIDSESYRLKIEEIMKCLNGNFRNTMSRLKAEMKMASINTNFEKAAQLRDDILGLEKLRKKQKRLCTDLDNKDVYLFFKAFGEDRFSLFFIRNGITLNRADFQDIQEPNIEKLTAYVKDNLVGLKTIESGACLTTHLLEIGACKLFMPVSWRADEFKVLNKLKKAFKEFNEIN